MNYTELTDFVLAEVEDYSDTIEANMDNLIQMAENRILYEVQLPEFQANTTLTTTAHNALLAMPADWLATYVITLTSGTTYTSLLPKDVGFIREAYPDSTEEGLPRFYAVYNDNQLILGPTPDQEYNTALSYLYKPESIVTANSTWLGDNMPALLSSAVVLEAYLFIKSEADMLQAWQTRYKEALDRAKNYGDGLVQRDDFRNGQTRVVPVT